MERVDLRKLDYGELYLVKKQVIELKKKGFTGAEIEEMTGVIKGSVSKIWRAYQRDGTDGIKPKTRGRKKGEQTLLTSEQEREVRQTIIDKRPDQMKLSFALWTRQAVSDLVKRLYGVDLSLRTVTNYLDRWGFTCQRPTTKAYSQDDVKVKAFMEDEYPAIARRAAAEGAEIYWGDETGINNQEHYQRGFSPRGVTPQMMNEGKREKVSMISAITGRGTARFMIYEGAMTQQRFIAFMRRLTHDADRKVFLVVDNLVVHHGKLVQKWLEGHKDNIEVFYLPSYAPELNPDEYLNHALKLDVHSGTRPRTKKDLHHRTESFMRRLQHDSKRIANLFKHPKLEYLNVNI